MAVEHTTDCLNELEHPKAKIIPRDWSASRTKNVPRARTIPMAKDIPHVECTKSVEHTKYIGHTRSSSTGALVRTGLMWDMVHTTSMQSSSEIGDLKVMVHDGVIPPFWSTFRLPVETGK